MIVLGLYSTLSVKCTDLARDRGEDSVGGRDLRMGLRDKEEMAVGTAVPCISLYYMGNKLGKMAEMDLEDKDLLSEFYIFPRIPQYLPFSVVPTGQNR